MTRSEAGHRGAERSTKVRNLSRAEGLAWARAWRERMKPFFDALYPPEVSA